MLIQLRFGAAKRLPVSVISAYKRYACVLMTGIMITAGMATAQAQTGFVVKTLSASVNGTSSLHSWKSAITKTEFKGELVTTGKALTAIKNIEVRIGVKSIKSKEGRVMDKKTYEAFKSDANPSISFTCSSAPVKVDAAKNVTISGTGNLTMAGVTHPVTLTANGKLLANGDLSLSISKTLNMTEYDMKPPKAVLGTITVGPVVTVQFDMVLTPSKLIAAKK